MKSKLPLIFVMSLAGCGGGDGGGNHVAPGSADPQGLFAGTLGSGPTSLDNPVDSFFCLIDANHDGYCIDLDDSAIYRLTNLDVSGNDFSGTFRGYAGTGATLPNGQSVEMFSIQGQFDEKVNLFGELAPSQGGDQRLVNVIYDFHFGFNYEGFPGSFATITGDYQYSYSIGDTTHTVAIHVGTDGAISGTDAPGCTVSGAATIPDARYNAYELSLTRTCGSTVTNSTGFAYFEPTSNSASAAVTLPIEYDNGSDQAVYAIASRQ